MNLVKRIEGAITPERLAEQGNLGRSKREAKVVEEILQCGVVPRSK